MDPDRTPSTGPDDEVVAYLRTRAPGVPAATYNGFAVATRARDVLRRRRRRRVRTGLVSVAGAAAVYLALALAGPVPVPGVGPVSVPGGQALRAFVTDLIPDRPPGPDDWPDDIGPLQEEVLPVVLDLRITYYLQDSETCRVLEYPRGAFRDGDPACRDRVPFDATARADFDRVTAAIERSGVAVERIYRTAEWVHIRIPDASWRYNYEYVHMPGVDTPPPARFEGETWNRVQGDWWFHRDHDD